MKKRIYDFFYAHLVLKRMLQLVVQKLHSKKKLGNNFSVWFYRCECRERAGHISQYPNVFLLYLNACVEVSCFV